MFSFFPIFFFPISLPLQRVSDELTFYFFQKMVLLIVQFHSLAMFTLFPV